MLPAQRLAACLLAAALVALAARGGAEADRFRREYPVQALAITDTSAEIGIEYNYFGETIRRSGGGRTRYSNNYLQEYYQARIRGYAYHPRFLTYSAQVKLGLSQQWLKRESPGDSTSSQDNDELVGYDLRVDLFKEHPVSGTVFARRDERILMGLFVDRYLVRTESQGATVRWRNGVAPMDLSFTRSRIDEYGADSSSTTLSDTLEYNLHHSIGKRSQTDVQYRYQSFDRDFQANTFNGDVERESELNTHTLQATNRLNLDVAGRANLRSTVRYHRQRNNQDLMTYYWQERLQLEHTENLRSYILASFLRNDYSDHRQTDTYRGEIGVDHQLFDSLKSHLDVHGRRTVTQATEEDRYGVTGRLNYRKNTALGVLSAGYSRTFDRVTRTGGDAHDDILDEAITIFIAVPAFLSRSDVVDSSIVVTDPTNTIIYNEGFDYELTHQGRRTGLRVVPGGLIADGDLVLVDYRVEIDGDIAYIADDQDVYVRHDFDRYLRGLSLYAQQHDLRARSVDAFDDNFGLVEYTDRMAGLRQEWRDFAFVSEYQDYEDDLGGFTQWRNRIEGNHRINSRIRWGWHAGINQTRYDSEREIGDDDESEYRFAGAHINGTFTRHGYWKVEARTMQETGRTERTTNGIIARVGFDWRRVTVEGGARFEEYDVFDSQRDRVQVFVRMKRTLGRRPEGYLR
ncbi:MAG: hypothetical protein PWP23_260 [Candidatus Sumerlaeota bacterium]|nr:hypothetical protein [Candidatus Sumerlaeota bacterium]